MSVHVFLSVFYMINNKGKKTGKIVYILGVYILMYSWFFEGVAVSFSVSDVVL